MLRLPGQVVVHVAVDLGVVEGGLELVLQVVAQFDEAGGLGRHLFAGDLAGLAQADDAGDVEGAGAHAALVAAAVDLFGDLDAGVAAADVEGTDAFGPVDLVRGERQDVDVHRAGRRRGSCRRPARASV